MVETFYTGLSAVASEMKKLVQRFAPDHLDRLYQSRPSAESCLTDNDPKLRLAAVVVIAHHWGLDAVFRTACETLLFNDPDADVRLYAVGYLGYCYYHTDDPRIGRIAAEIVYDNTRPKGLRRGAYGALFKLRASAEVAVAKRNRPTARDFRFPEDVDWRFVDTFLFGGKKIGTHPRDVNGLLFQ